jgi:type II secretory pathway component PulL
MIANIDLSNPDVVLFTTLILVFWILTLVMAHYAGQDAEHKRQRKIYSSLFPESRDKDGKSFHGRNDK